MKAKHIREIVKFIGEFELRNRSLPPGCDQLLKPISKNPKELMSFLKIVEKEYPPVLRELILRDNGDDTADDTITGHLPKEREIKARLTVHKRAEQERMFQ